jgi:hypothetical protein
MVATGAAVNSLSFADHGVDIHLLLPEWGHDPGAGAVTWDMSNDAVHVQVKSTEGGNSPRVSLGHLKQYTRSGPAVFLAHAGPSLAYATPADLVALRDDVQRRHPHAKDNDEFTVGAKYRRHCSATELLDWFRLFDTFPATGPGPTFHSLLSRATDEVLLGDLASAIWAAEHPSNGLMGHERFADTHIDVVTRLLGWDDLAGDEPRAQQRARDWSSIVIQFYWMLTGMIVPPPPGQPQLWDQPESQQRDVHFTNAVSAVNTVLTKSGGADRYAAAQWILDRLHPGWPLPLPTTEPDLSDMDANLRALYSESTMNQEVPVQR